MDFAAGEGDDFFNLQLHFIAKQVTAAAHENSPLGGQRFHVLLGSFPDASADFPRSIQEFDREVVVAVAGNAELLLSESKSSRHLLMGF